MKKYIFGTLLSLATLLSPLLVQAQVQGDVNPNQSQSSCFDLGHDLGYQSTDVATSGSVSLLQDFLQSKGYLNNEPTGYFGLLTVNAVKSFQSASNILNSGYVGPITRAKIKTISCGAAANTTYNLTVTKAGTGTGTVNRIILSDSSLNSVFPNGIPVSFSSGASVVIDATPSSGSTFAGWSGACIGTPTTCTVAMSTERNVTATFNSNQTGVGACGTADTHVFANAETVWGNYPQCPNGSTPSVTTFPALGGMSSWTCSLGGPVCKAYHALPQPSMNAVSCNAAGTQATLTWGSVTGATRYPVRVDNPATTCVNGSTNNNVTGPATYRCDTNTEYVNDGLTGTSVAVNISPNTSYKWWVHSLIKTASLSGDGGMELWSSGTPTTFTCPGTSVLTITTPLTLPTATVGTPYTLTFAATSGTGALLWNLNPYNGRASLGGLEWSNSNSSGGSSGLGVISGTPTTAGTYKFTITVGDSVGHSYAREFTLLVNSSSGANGTCTSWTYSAWGTCQSNGIQTRTYSSASATPAGCTGGSPTVSQICTYTPSAVTPPVTISCTGTPPPTGNGVVANGYTTVSAGGGGIISSNTVWQYGAASCGWSCTAPMLQDGNVGCKNPTAGSGVIVTFNNLSTGQKVSGATVTATTVITIIGGLPALGSGGSSGTFATDSNGKTPEFWFQQGPTGSWTSIGVQMSGYKIRSAVGCTPRVYVNGGKQWNYCVSAVNGTPITINLVPGDISTLPTTVFPKSTFSVGESLTGTVVGGDPKDTWGCMDSPNTVPGHECTSGWANVWRQLTAPYDGHADGWHLVETNYGDTIQLSPMSTVGFPAGTYTSYVKMGQWGTPGQMSSTRFTLTAQQSQLNTATLSVSITGTGSGVVSSTEGIGCEVGGTLCSHSYANGTSVTLYAGEFSGSTFAGWGGSCSGTSSTCTVIMSASQSVTATFTATSASSVSAAPHIASISPTSGTGGTIVTINGSGFTGTNQIYLDGIPVDTYTTSGGPTPPWISFVIPAYLPSCPSYIRPPFCVNGPALQVGTHSVSVRNANGNGASNAVSLGVN